MMKYILFFFLLFSFTVKSQTLSFTQLTTDFPRPFSGAEKWGTTDWDGTNVPLLPAGNTNPFNGYQRFVWGQIEKSQGVYSFADFDGYVNRAIAAGVRFSFGVMAICSSCDMMPTYGYPDYIHAGMAKEAQPDWHYSGNGYSIWVPNWNSPTYLNGYTAMLNALAAHIATMSYNGRDYKDIIQYVDIRGYGDFGEWHTYPWVGTEPTGRAATVATLEAIVEATKKAFPNYQLIIPMGAFDTDKQHSSRLPAEFGYYALTTSNAFGQIGWRRDNFGDPDYNPWLTASPGTYNGIGFTSLILNKYKFAPVGGEPNNGLAAVSTCGSPYCDLLNEINLFHVNSFGNGNYPGLKTTNTAWVNNMLAASKASGAHLSVNGGNISQSGSTLTVALQWINTGVSPVYDNWDVNFELRSSSGVVATTTISTFKPRLFIGSGSSTDNITIPSGGPYSFYLVLRNPVGYMKPYPLNISGRGADGAYLIKTGITGSGSTGPVNPPPPLNCDTVIYRLDSQRVINSKTYTIYDTLWATKTVADTVKRSCTVIPPPVDTSKSVSLLTGQPTGAGEKDGTNTITVGVKFSSTIPGFITGARFYKTVNNTGTHTAILYSSTGSILASAPFTNETASGWQTVSFTKVPIVAGTSYVIAYYSSSGYYVSTTNYFPKTNQTLTGSLGVYNYGQKFPTATYLNSNYWIDPIFSK